MNQRTNQTTAKKLNKNGKRSIARINTGKLELYNTQRYQHKFISKIIKDTKKFIKDKETSKIPKKNFKFTWIIFSLKTAL